MKQVAKESVSKTIGPVTAFWPRDYKDLVETAKLLITTTALLVGGLWTYTIFVQQRNPFPVIDLKHTVLAKVLAEPLLYLQVTITITNTGKTHVTLEEQHVWIQQILPILPCPKDPQCIGNRIQQVLAGEPVSIEHLVPEDEMEIAWPRIARKTITGADARAIELEPGEVHHEYYNFIIPADVRTLQVYTHFPHADRRDLSWQHNTIHDTQTLLNGKDPH